MATYVRMPDHIRDLALSGWESYLPLSDALEEAGFIRWAEHVRKHAARFGDTCCFINANGEFQLRRFEGELEEYAKKSGK